MNSSADLAKDRFLWKASGRRFSGLHCQSDKGGIHGGSAGTTSSVGAPLGQNKRKLRVMDVGKEIRQLKRGIVESSSLS